MVVGQEEKGGELGSESGHKELLSLSCCLPRRLGRIRRHNCSNSILFVTQLRGGDMKSGLGLFLLVCLGVFHAGGWTVDILQDLGLDVSEQNQMTCISS